MGRFNPGDRVYWYKYSFEGIIIDAGYGVVIQKLKSLRHTNMFEILIDGGDIKIFSYMDLDLVK